MSSPNRLIELENALLLRYEEIEQHKKLLARLQLQNENNPMIEAAPNGDKMDTPPAPPPPQLQDIIFSHPALKFCDDAHSVSDVAPEQVGNVILLMDSALDGFKVKCKKAEHVNGTIQRSICHEEVRQGTLLQQIDLMSELTGLKPCKINNVQRNPEVHCTPEDIVMQPKASKHSVNDLRSLIRNTEKEIRTARVLLGKKERTIQELQKTLDAKVTIVEGTNEVLNMIRVKDRDIREKKVQLVQLMEEHSAADDRILEQKVIESHPAKAILGHDVQRLKHELTKGALEDRLQQDRVLKAQDYRIEVLKKRIATLEACFKHQRLPLTTTLSAHVVVEDEAVDQQLYDIDAIIPPDEQIPKSFCQVLLGSKQRREHSIRLQRIMLSEKSEALDSMMDKVGDMTNELDVATGSLNITANEAMFLEEEHKENIVAAITESRCRFNDLLCRKREMQRQLRTKGQPIISEEKKR